MSKAYPRWFSPALFLIMLGAVLIRFFFWHYTGRTWEDALITVLHSENAASGLGLTHLQPPGEPALHGFTSPLSVLIPLLGDLVRVGWGLPFLKLVSAFSAAIAVWLVARIAQVVNLPASLALTAAAYVAFEHHQILWGMAGMETEVVIVAYLFSMYAMQRGTQWQKGLSFGFVMLARPDAAIWVAIAFAVELWRAKKAGSWRGLIPVVAGFTVLYAPWIIFTTLYYGSPVPNTIHAKSLGYRSMLEQLRMRPPSQYGQWLIHRVYDTLGSLGRSYGGNGTGYLSMGHGRILAFTMILLSAVGAVFAIRRRHLQAILIFAFGFTYAAYLCFCAPVIFGWYTTPVAAAVLLGSLYGLWGLAQYLPASQARGPVVAVAGALYILALVTALPATFRSDKYIQLYIESGVRKNMGLFLRQVSMPTDTIASESLGYVGYYSRRVVYDYPGLCSREVIRYLRQNPNNRNILGMMHALRPTYMVLRPREFRDPEGNLRAPWIAQDYDLVRVFKASPEYRQKILDPEWNIDVEFDVFRLKGAPSRPE